MSLRDIAAAADGHLSLIGRYIGRRDELVAAVFGHVSYQLARAVEENPLSGHGFSPDTVMGKWVRIAAALMISGRSLESRHDFNPVVAMAETLMARYSLAGEAARLRAAQIVAAAPGPRPDTVKAGLTPKRPRRQVENDEYAAFGRRILRAYALAQ